MSEAIAPGDVSVFLNQMDAIHRDLQASARLQALRLTLDATRLPEAEYKDFIQRIRTVLFQSDLGDTV